MKLQLISDIHLEFNHDFKVPDLGADVLILAGDICPVRKINLLHFLEYMSTRYAHVIYVMGNHEYYGNCFPLKAGLVLPANVHLLNDSDVTIDGVHFVGATLWSDLSDGLSAMLAKQGMNDYKSITYHRKGLYRKLDPIDTTLAHKRSVEYFRNTITPNSIVVTHHAPTHKSIHPGYAGDSMNVAFYTDLSGLILDTKPKMWLHGHTHNYSKYYIGDTLVMANPVGYPGERTGACLQQVIELRREMQRIYDKDSLVVYVKDVLDKLDKIIDDGQRKSS